jgi:DNA-directed RNA polymerase subunit M/transcription elongation factor TFIIS
MTTIQFCNKCDFMYYLRISKTDDNNLEYYCRHCGNIETELTKGICVLNTKFTSKQNLNHLINQYTKMDPRLPHISNIPCPNVDCKCNKQKDVSPDIIYKRYNDADMKYIYICVHCDYIWETNNITT